MQDPRISFVLNVFNNFIATNRKKLEAGMARREAIRIRLERGEAVSNYRTKFIRDAAVKVIDTLRLEALAFNTKNRDDLCSSQDLIDILTTATGLIKGEID